MWDKVERGSSLSFFMTWVRKFPGLIFQLEKSTNFQILNLFLTLLASTRLIIANYYKKVSKKLTDWSDPSEGISRTHVDAT